MRRVHDVRNQMELKPPTGNDAHTNNKRFIVRDRVQRGSSHALAFHSLYLVFQYCPIARKPHATRPRTASIMSTSVKINLFLSEILPKR